MWKEEGSPKHEPSFKTEDAQPPQTVGPATATRPLDDERRVVAWVGQSVVFKGDLRSAEDMTIDGRVEGTIDLRDHGLTIGPHAKIQANIVAKTVTIRGAVTGSITASDKVVVSEAGSVEGDITSPRLALADGAVLRGRVDTVAGHPAASHVRRLAAV